MDMSFFLLTFIDFSLFCRLTALIRGSTDFFDTSLGSPYANKFLQTDTIASCVTSVQYNRYCDKTSLATSSSDMRS